MSSGRTSCRIGHSFGPKGGYAQLKGHPVDIVAQDIARGTKILCLDELHVSDVADALILGQLFSRMLQQGTFVLFTSNKTPAELYNNGLNRQYFLPFIKMLQKQLAVVEVSGATDYRLQDQVLESILAAPSTTSSGHAKRGTVEQVQQGLMLLGQNSSAQLEAAWCTTVGSLQSQARLDVGFGRRLHVPRQLSGHQVLEAEGADSHHTLPAAFFTFDQGLGQGVDQGGALGPADMVALAAAYPLVFIQNLPVLQWSQRNEARRLVTLIDTLYDMRCSLECSAAGKPKQIFEGLLNHARRLGVFTNSVLSSASAKLEQAGEAAAELDPEGRAELTEHSDDEEPILLALLQEEVVMYQRAISRLSEMCKIQTA
ncbi:MAG: hypothetical protein FRX49_11311 [Trebouxia sp. A1-2]|nr:MAG: hypothetical protein FRX49_11311 [Trebouxia sp. A1-2]